MKALLLWTETPAGLALDDYETEIRSWFGAERATGFFCHADAGSVKPCRSSSHRFGKFCNRGVLRQATSIARRREAPAWKTSSSTFLPPMSGVKSYAHYSVPRASAPQPTEPVDYAARLADRETRPADAKPMWLAPDTELIDSASYTK